MRKNTWIRLILAAACLGLALLCRFAPGLCRWYALGAQPAVQRAQYRIARTLPCSPALAQAALFAAFLVRTLRRHRGKPRLWLTAWLNVALFALLLLMLLWLPLYSLPRVRPIRPGGEELSGLCRNLIQDLDRAGEPLPGREAVDSWCAAAAREAESVCGHPFLPPRAVSGGFLLDKLGIAGFYWPLTGESLVNTDDLITLIPFTICHELAHQAGYAREGEANRAAWRLCGRLGGIFLQSARLYALSTLMPELKAVDPAAWQALSDALDEPARKLLQASGALRPPRPPSLCDRMADAFLRLCGDSGLVSYQEGVWACLGT